MLDLAGQSNAFRFWALASSIALAILAFLAGAVLLFAERMTADFDLEPSREFEFFSALGLWGIAAAWLAHTAVLAWMAGKEPAEHRTTILVITFLAAFLYLFFVLACGFLPFIRCRMTIT